MTGAIAWVISRTIVLRVDREVEAEGVDEGEHAESGYDFSTVVVGHRTERPGAVHSVRNLPMISDSLIDSSL